MKRIRAALVSFSLVALAGCGAGATSPKTVPTPTATTPTATATPTATPTAKSSPVARVPQGWRTVTAKKSGLRFAVPKTWTKMDASKLKDARLKATWERFAKSLGITPDQLQQVFAQIDLMAISPSLAPKDYAEVEVIPVPLIAELPTRESLRAQFAALKGVHVLGFRDVATPVGKGLISNLRKQVPDRGTLFSENVFVQVDSGVVGLTVTASTQQRARAMIDKMIGSLRDAGRGGAVGNGSAVTG